MKRPTPGDTAGYLIAAIAVIGWAIVLYLLFTGRLI